MSIAQPSAAKIADLYAGKAPQLMARIAKEPKGPTGLPLDLSKLMALNIDLTETDAAKRQAAMVGLQQMQQGQAEPPTVAQTIQQQAAEKAKALAVQAQRQQQGLQALAQNQGLMGAVPAQTPQPERQPAGIDELRANLGDNYASGGIVAFNGEEDSDVKDKDKLTAEEARDIMRRLKQRTDMRPESMAITDMDTTSIPGFVAGNRFQQEMDKINPRVSAPTPQQIEANVKPEDTRQPYSGLRQKTLQEQGADYVARRQAERDARAEQESPENIARREALISQIPTGGQTAPASNRRGEDSELERNISNTLAALPGASVTRAPTGIRALAPALAAMFSRDKTEKAPEVDNRALLNAAEQRMREPTPVDNRAALNAADAGLRALPAAAAVPQRRPSGVATLQPFAAQTAQAAPVTPAAAPVDPMTERLNNFFKAAIEKTPAQQREDAINRMKEAFGAPDTSAQEKYIQQLEARRAALAEPTDTYERLRNYLRTASTAGGRTSFQTGANTSALMEAQRQAKQQKDMEILKELMGESGKLADVKRGYKKELFGFGEKTYDDAFKTGMDVAKELKLDSRQAQLFAHQSAENALQRANSLKVAGMPGAEERMFNQVARDWLAKPENKGKTIADAYAAFNIMRSPAAGAKLGGVMSRDQAEDNVRKDLENMMTGPKMISDASAALKAQGIQNPTSLQIKDYLVQQQMTKPAGGAPMASSGKVPALPSGFKLD